MTNKEDILSEGDIGNDAQAATMTALHLVGEVMSEANVIVNAAHESGQPWRYVSMLKSLRNGSLGEHEFVDMSYLISKGDCDSIVKKNPELVATSTPQKNSAELKRNKSESNLVGQGDEPNEMQQNELTKSTSMFINNLFDMSEVESALNDPNVNATNTSSSNPDKPEKEETDENDVITRAMTTLMKSFVFTAMSAAFNQHSKMINETYDVAQDNSKSNYSDNSFLADAGDAKLANDSSFFINEGLPKVESHVEPTYPTCQCRCEQNIPIDVNDETSKDFMKFNENYSASKDDLCVESTTCDPNETIIINVAKEDGENVEETNVTLDENLYLTLNRDYEQYSEEGDQITQDSKNINLHEIELLTAQTSEINLTPHPEESEKLTDELAATSTVRASAADVNKNSLMNRCRIQGTRLLSCIRGWWRRKTPSKRSNFFRSNGSRGPGSVRGMCPLSPDARRRASSLLDQRRLCSPSPCCALRKFNTVNEALVKSSRWKDSYTFETKFDESGEY